MLYVSTGIPTNVLLPAFYTCRLKELMSCGLLAGCLSWHSCRGRKVY